MRPLFPKAKSFATNAGQIYDACLKLGLNSPNEIRNALQWQEGQTDERGFQVSRKVADFIQGHGQVQLEVDPLSSDQPAVLILEDAERVERLRKMYPSGRGIGRATRLMSLAKQVQDLPPEAAVH